MHIIFYFHFLFYELFRICKTNIYKGYNWEPIEKNNNGLNYVIKSPLLHLGHPGLTRVRSIRFLLFEILSWSKVTPFWNIDKTVKSTWGLKLETLIYISVFNFTFLLKKDWKRIWLYIQRWFSEKGFLGPSLVFFVF